MTSGRLPKWLTSAQAAIALFFAIALVVGALPPYFQGKLPTDSTIQEVQLKTLKSIVQDGLEIENWSVVDASQLTLGPYEWLQQVVRADPETPHAEREALLLIHPQKSATGTSSLPQTEWSDIEGLLGGQGDLELDNWNWMEFPVLDADGQESGGTVNARFFRTWTPAQTYATTAWYAWPNGGHYSGARWFLTDLGAQLSGTRQPWAAVAVLVPIEVRGDIEGAREVATDLAQAIHTALRQSGLVEAIPSSPQ
ncbi:MAG: cyanoexosortase B system-associated protein [Geitlerinemataceae cyanobacterium]